MYKTLFISFFFLVGLVIHAQNPDIRRTYHWYFGNNAGLDFSSGTPVPITSSAMTAEEGCASISDTCGNLLFYTDGDTVWNRNNQVMQNGTGLMGCYSSAQTALIVPQPGNDSIYFIFLTDCWENMGNNGLRYSIVNMNMSGGFGAVTAKNILMYAPAREKLAATYHANGQDVWILGVNSYPSGPPPDTTYQYFAYSLTSSGVSPTPVVSPSVVHPHKYAFGYLRFSYQGDKVASNWTLFYGDTLELLSFNKTNGILSNPIIIPGTDTTALGYGLVFSPDDSKLYHSFADPEANDVKYWYFKIYQYDLSIYNSTAIISSKTLIQLSDSTKDQIPWYMAMQLGADGKIYVATNYSYPPYFPDTIAVITNPNALGPSCNFVDKGAYIGGSSWWGLPNFVDSYFSNSWKPPCNVGIEENIVSERIIIYPNPFSSSVTIRINEEIKILNAKVTIYDFLGKAIVSLPVTNHQFTIQRNNLQQGIYFLQIKTENKQITEKLIITNH